MTGHSASPGLLVSVRSAEEACAALAGGADIIDIKEPARGSLGRADDQTIRSILDVVAGRRPVSAALGELAEGLPAVREPRLAYVKWGLAAPRTAPLGWWRELLNRELQYSHPPRTVVAAYADWECAHAPPVEEVVAFACTRAGSVLLLDTHCKEPGTLARAVRPTLLDWLPVPLICDICKRCRAAGVRVALAGSLGIDDIRQLRGACPDWFAVRGAVCHEGNRLAGIDDGRVKRLREELQSP